MLKIKTYHGINTFVSLWLNDSMSKDGSVSTIFEVSSYAYQSHPQKMQNGSEIIISYEQKTRSTTKKSMGWHVIWHQSHIRNNKKYSSMSKNSNELTYLMFWPKVEDTVTLLGTKCNVVEIIFLICILPSRIYAVFSISFELANKVRNNFVNLTGVISNILSKPHFVSRNQWFSIDFE